MALVVLLGVSMVAVSFTLATSSPADPKGTPDPELSEITGPPARGFAMLTNATSTISLNTAVVLPGGQLPWSTAAGHAVIDIRTGHSKVASGQMTCEGDFGGVRTTFQMNWAPFQTQPQVYSGTSVMYPRYGPKVFEAGSPIDFRAAVLCDVTMSTPTEGYVALTVQPVLRPVG